MTTTGTPMRGPTADDPAFDPEARRPWEAVAGLGVPFGYERSFRVSRGALLANRFLLSVAREALGGTPLRTFANLCRRLAMPEPLLHAAAGHFDAAGFLHVGYEEGPTSRLCKVYLETRVPADRQDPSAPILLHRAYKWDLADPARQAETHYVWHPGLSLPAMLERLAETYGAGDGGTSHAIAREVLATAAERLAAGSLRYLEVTEGRNPRRSFDLNLYDAGLSIGDLAPALGRMAHQFAIAPDRLRALTDPIAAKRVGHLAGGVHRAGEDFLTVYYGVEGR